MPSMMMSKDATSSSPSARTLRDGGASGGFLSKASNSIRRSPSKRHKSRSSNPLPPLDRIFFDTQKSLPFEPPPPPTKRPDVYRTQTAPLVTQTIKSAVEEVKTARSAVEAAVVVTSSASNQKKDVPTTLSKGAGPAPGPTPGPGAMHQNGEYVHYAATDASLPAPTYVPGTQNPAMLYQYIHEMSNKRISTLDYFRKAYV